MLREALGPWLVARPNLAAALITAGGLWAITTLLLVGTHQSLPEILDLGVPRIPGLSIETQRHATLGFYCQRILQAASFVFVASYFLFHHLNNKKG